MKIKKYTEFINESEIGKVILSIDGKKSTWYYLSDAILNGFLEEYLELESYYDEDLFEDVSSNDELSDLLVDDFSNIMDKLVELEKFSMPQSVHIVGVDDDGYVVNEEWDK